MKSGSFVAAVPIASRLTIEWPLGPHAAEGIVIVRTSRNVSDNVIMARMFCDYNRA